MTPASPTDRPGVVHETLGIAGIAHTLYAVRTDGAAFVLVKRNEILLDMSVAKEPYWARIPAIPGTIAWHEEQRGG